MSDDILEEIMNADVNEIGITEISADFGFPDDDLNNGTMDVVEVKSLQSENKSVFANLKNHSWTISEELYKASQKLQRPMKKRKSFIQGRRKQNDSVERVTGNGRFGEEDKGGEGLVQTIRTIDIGEDPFRPGGVKSAPVRADDALLTHSPPTPTMAFEDIPINIPIRFFIIQCASEGDVKMSQKYNMWSTDALTAKRLKIAYENPRKPRIFLVFISQNYFHGYGEMRDSPTEVTEGNSQFTHDFNVNWNLIVKVPSSHASHLCLPDMDRTSVNLLPHGHEIPILLGKSLVDLFIQTKSGLVERLLKCVEGDFTHPPDGTGDPFQSQLEANGINYADEVDGVEYGEIFEFDNGPTRDVRNLDPVDNASYSRSSYKYKSRSRKRAIYRAEPERPVSQVSWDPVENAPKQTETPELLDGECVDLFQSYSNPSLNDVFTQ